MQRVPFGAVFPMCAGHVETQVLTGGLELTLPANAAVLTSAWSDGWWWSTYF